MLPHSSPQLGKIGRMNEVQKNVTWKLPDIEKTANACSDRSISDRLIGGISSLPPLALRGSLCVTSHPSPIFLLVATLVPRGAGPARSQITSTASVYRVTCDGASVGRWFLDIESRKAAYAHQGKQARTAE